VRVVSAEEDVDAGFGQDDVEWAWQRRKSAHVLQARSGAGSMPASFIISHGRSGYFHAQHQQFALTMPKSLERAM
jgi:hypothetical protein